MRGIRSLDLAAAVTIVACLAGLAFVLREAPVTGGAVAVDGDTLVLEGRRIRLRGMDAPELGQTCLRGEIAWRCGEEARAALRLLVSGRTVSCSGGGLDRYERLLATCTVEGADIGADLVRRGLAVAVGAYGREEREAREARRGVWSGSFEAPQDWRRRHGADGRSS